MKTHQGSCHCKAVTWEVDADIKEVLSCNCSICSRKGYLLTFVQPEAFRLMTGENNLTDYQFNHKHIHHTFCKTCGIESFARGDDGKGNEMVAINVLCIPDIDIDSLEVRKYNGKDD